MIGTKAVAEVENAFAYEGQKLRIARRDGDAEQTSEYALSRKDQFALEIDHMAECVRANVQPRTPGEEGLADQIVMAAIYEAARTGRVVTLDAVGGIDPFRGPPPSSAS